MKMFFRVLLGVCLLSVFVGVVVVELRGPIDSVVTAAIVGGYDVSTIQSRLKSGGYYTGKVDGVYGSGTRNAVKSFQSKNGLKSDGVVGPATAKALGLSGASAGNVPAGKDSVSVKTYQQKLKTLGYYTGTADGIKGAKTVAAVKAFQSKKGLKADGVVGAATAKAMGLATQSTGGNYGNNDLYVLAKCVYAEARGEPYVGQVAIAAVILNRVRSSQFPNTVSGVIYQPWAFTAVNDGQIKLEPNATARQAAQDALNGWDPTYGSIYYYNPVTATSKWIFSRKTTTTIGRHVFAI